MCAKLMQAINILKAKQKLKLHTSYLHPCLSLFTQCHSIHILAISCKYLIPLIVFTMHPLCFWLFYFQAKTSTLTSAWTFGTAALYFMQCKLTYVTVHLSAIIAECARSTLWTKGFVTKVTLLDHKILTTTSNTVSLTAFTQTAVHHGIAGKAPDTRATWALQYWRALAARCSVALLASTNERTVEASSFLTLLTCNCWQAFIAMNLFTMLT